ncbi:intraflagellar transport protein 52 homolog [Cimex lectularius]|uniref:Intraflagellar transport protein 52 homolog n=1 Tax=Cimex lectularius TaxID=79782 RepID=A0A8I6TJ35_CIMLE|nr:intraflagellar transport protein 52 homolog [Cimex lectularius]
MPPIEGPPLQDNYEKSIVFDQSKNELFKINDNYKGLHRKIKVNWKVEVNKDEITPEVLKYAAVFIIPSPRENFTENEFNTLKGYLDGGGSVLVTLGEGGEKKFETNINYLLEEYGIMINSDSVVRTHYYKYFHPKECLIPNGVLNRGIAKLLGKEVNKDFVQCLSFVYPYGATLNTAKPAVPILSSGPASWPLNRPVCALASLSTTSKVKTGGKICVLGSGYVFADKYLEKEDNSQLLNVITTYLTTENLELNPIDTEDPEVSEYTVVADTCAISEKIRGCLIETTEDLPSDYMNLFNTDSFYWVSLDHVASVINAYNELDVPHSNLKLAVPSFEESVPKLEPAVFPPRFLDLGPPALELYDLQEEFYSEVSRLSQTANKILSTSLKNAERTVGERRPQVEAEIEDVEYFTLECAQILGINSTNVRSILWQVSLLIGSFKKNLHK